MKKQQAGSTLMIVLLIIVVMIALASAMTLNNRSAMKRTMQLDTYQQIRHDIDAATRLVQIILQKSLKGQPVTSLDQPWSLAGTNYHLEHAMLQGSVEDMRRCYNINVLHTLVENEAGEWPDEVEKLVELMVALDIKRPKARQLVAVLWDFIDNDSLPHSGGAEDEIYLGKNTAYVSANQLLADISELRVIEGMTKVMYQKLISHLCVLPDENLSFNINTLTKKHSVLLQVFSQKKLSKEAISQWLDYRPLGGWKSVEQALNAPALNKLSEADKALLAPYLRVNSDYFRFNGMLITDDMTYRWTTLWHWKDPTITPVQYMEQ